jgi:hypothetical protein
MPVIEDNYILGGAERDQPLLWQVTVPVAAHHLVDTCDEAMHAVLGPGTARALKSFGHNDKGVHYLLLRGGTGVHTDTAYTRYTMQLVLRNDGTRIRGLPRLDGPPESWHPPMAPGVMYCLDTHSPHQGCPDPRMNPPARGYMKAVIAVDRDNPLDPEDAWLLLSGYLLRQFADFPVTRRPPRGAAARAGG